MKIESLINNRKRLIQAHEDNCFTSGIRSLLTDLYPDTAHFIYEILQNAEDMHASEARFILTSKGVAFSHNGDLRDVKNNSEDIEDSNINESDKKPGTDPKVKKPRVYGNEVEQFFLDKGLEVINTRKKDGYLRVIGDEEQIGEYVNEAISKFGISGQYGKSKATKLREAWATKTRK